MAERKAKAAVASVQPKQESKPTPIKRAIKKATDNKRKGWKEIKNNWVIKDRYYALRNGETSLTRVLKSKRIMWFDEDAGKEREVAYAVNQETPFVDEFRGEARLEHIIFRDGVLFVPKEKVILQQILSELHPKVGKLYIERDEEAEAVDELEMLELEIEAVNEAKALDIDKVEAIMRTKHGSSVTSLSSKELRRDIILFAKENPILLLELANDEDLEIRNDGIRGVEKGVINLTNSNSLFVWASTGVKLCKVPFEEEPYTVLARYFKTEEGTDVYKSLKKQLLAFE